jgi:hypothetical protein
MPPSGVDYASRFLNGYAPEYVGFSYKYRLIEECHYRISIMALSVKLRVSFHVIRISLGILTEFEVDTMDV